MFSSCTTFLTIKLENIPSTFSTDKNIGLYYVETFNIDLDKDIINKENLEKLKSFNGAFQKTLTESNLKNDHSLHVHIEVLIKKLKIKNTFARIHKMLGGNDIIIADVQVKDLNGKLIKKYKSEMESGVIEKEEFVYKISTLLILNEVLKLK